jgi:phospholipid transport system transporter-binding protein
MPQTNHLDGIATLTFPNATVALKQGLAAIAGGKTVFDLSSVKAVDSSAVAILLEWKRAARRAGKALAYVNLPASLQSLATLYGVDEFLVDTPANLQHH